MSWWLILIAAFVLLRISRERRRERRLRWGGYGRFPGPAWSRRRGGGLHPAGPPPVPSAPDPRKELELTIAAARDAYVAGRITVEEYERRLEELYRTAEGRRLVQS